MTITINNIEDFVDTFLLERGKAFIENGTIIEIEELYENDFTALMKGTDIYPVNIRINKESVLLTHACNCPYNSGPICKHKVALILQIRENKRNGIPYKEGELTRIKKELKSCKKEELEQLILLLAKSSVATRKQLLFQLGIKTEQ